MRATWFANLKMLCATDDYFSFFMKTFFINAAETSSMRNLLTGEIFDLVKKNSEVRMVVFVQGGRRDEYRKLFLHERFVVEEAPDLPVKRIKRKAFFHMVAIASIPTSTIWLFQKYDYLDDRKLLKFLFRRVLWWAGHFSFWRALIRRIEFFCFREDAIWKEYFDRYSPDAVFAPSAIYEPDVLFIKYAKRRGVPSVGSLNGWDHLSGKGSLRALPDLLLVPNPLIMEEAVSFNDMRQDRVRAISFPWLDHYYDPSWNMTREEVSQKIGIDHKMRWIGYFIAGGPLTTRVLRKEDCENHIAILQNAVRQGTFGNAALVVSFYPSRRLEATEIPSGVFTIRFNEENYYYSRDGMKLSMNFIRHCDVAINFASSVSLEAALFDRPIILPVFNGPHDEVMPWQRRLSSLFDFTTSFLQLQHTGGAMRANSAEELVSAVKAYLENSGLHREERKRVVGELVGPADGKANQRIFDALLELA